jgi:uncharacterized membrane protein HdeD (DUF308 family)
MNLSTLLIALWIILVSISQYFLNWVQFGKTGLVVIGVLGLIGALLWLFSATYPINFKRRV